jgi:glycosyltransferase involved in cell wall biosynthesis
MKRIAMLLSNAFRPDPRVAKEAAGLANAGYAVEIFCWDREGSMPPDQMLDGYKIIRIQQIKSAYGKGPRQLFYTPRFWAAVWRLIRSNPPDIIHCHDLDTLPAGWWFKQRTGARLIYDAHEHYPALMTLYLPGWIVSALTILEKSLLKNVDYVITASSVLADRMLSSGIQPVATIGNYSLLGVFDTVTEEDIRRIRAELDIDSNDLVIAYIGGFTRNRMILPLIQAAGDMPGIQVVICGDGHQRAAIESSAAAAANIRYLGWLPDTQVPCYTKMADVVYYCLNPDYPGAIFNAPNTLSNAMAAGRPVIANDVGDLGRIIRSTGCGILLDRLTTGEIQKAIETLRSEPLRHTMGSAGRHAAEAQFNWKAAEEKLLEVYTEVLK